MLTFLGLKDALYPTTILRGVHLNVKIADLRGWTMFFSRPYSHASSIEDFTPPRDMPGNALLVGARRTGSDTLAIAAMGQAEKVTAETVVGTPREHNGVWWFCRPGLSVGFLPRATIA